jgi:hypothetical protein
MYVHNRYLYITEHFRWAPNPCRGQSGWGQEIFLISYFQVNILEVNILEVNILEVNILEVDILEVDIET